MRCVLTTGDAIGWNELSPRTEQLGRPPRIERRAQMLFVWIGLECLGCSAICLPYILGPNRQSRLGTRKAPLAWVGLFLLFASHAEGAGPSIAQQCCSISSRPWLAGQTTPAKPQIQWVFQNGALTGSGFLFLVLSVPFSSTPVQRHRLWCLEAGRRVNLGTPSGLFALRWLCIFVFLSLPFLLFLLLFCLLSPQLCFDSRSCFEESTAQPLPPSKHAWHVFQQRFLMQTRLCRIAMLNVSLYALCLSRFPRTVPLPPSSKMRRGLANFARLASGASLLPVLLFSRPGAVDWSTRLAALTYTHVDKPALLSRLN